MSIRSSRCVLAWLLLWLAGGTASVGKDGLQLPIAATVAVVDEDVEGSCLLQQSSQRRGGGGPRRRGRQDRGRRRDESFSLPFAYSVMAPGAGIVARLLLPASSACPETIVLTDAAGRRSTADVIVRAQPVGAHAAYYIDGKRYTSSEKLTVSVSEPQAPFGFDDRVCEAHLTTGQLKDIASARFELGGGPALDVPLPPRGDPRRVVVLGDTGLRIKSLNEGWCRGEYDGIVDGKLCSAEDVLDHFEPSLVDGFFQTEEASLDPEDNGWPFRRVAAEAAEAVRAAGPREAVVLHVGDFLYRLSPCPSDFPAEPNFTEAQAEKRRILGNCSGTTYGSHSEAWVADFFEPAAPLLAAAPWVNVRGNHEACSKGGLGYFRYLDPRPVDPELFAGAQRELPWCVEVTPPYAVDFEGDQWLVVDTASVAGEDVPIDDNPQQPFSAEDAARNDGTAVLPMGADCASSLKDGIDNAAAVRGLAALQAPGKRHWLAVHRPLFGLLFHGWGNDHASSRLYGLTCELVNALAVEGANLTDVPAVVSGHFHSFQMLAFERRPAQLIFGNGGTQLNVPWNGQSADLDLVAGLHATYLGERVLRSPTVGAWGYGVLEAGTDGRPPTATAVFLADADFKGAPAVSAELPPRPLSVGTGWLADDT